jgi:hypothetical protein
MTAPVTAPAGPARTRWRQRWYRLVIPFAVLGLLIGASWLARQQEEPDLSDPVTLAPDGTGPDGGSRLAGLLAERGVVVEPVTDLDQALAALERGGDAVVFVPKSTTAGAVFAGYAARQPAGHRVVLVAPSAVQLSLTGLPVARGQPRWAALATEPDCRVPEAVAAGAAAALRGRYAVEDRDAVCYRGGLVRVRPARAEVFVVGASDPFRNRRIDEHGNARLAVELLAARDRVIWAGALPVQARLPALGPPRRPDRDRTADGGFAELVAGYPPGVLAGLGLAGLVAVLVALARARRLGPPVTEPLPVPVPAAETVAGRGRLYQHTQGRAVALAALRRAALRRLVAGLGLPPVPPPEPASVVAAAAARTSLPAEHVRRTLYGPAPTTDAYLTTAVAALDALVAAASPASPAAPPKEPS